MAKMGTSEKKTEQRPIANRGKALFELTKTLDKIQVDEELIKKNQFTGVKSNGTSYNFLTKISDILTLGQQEKRNTSRNRKAQK